MTEKDFSFYYGENRYSLKDFCDEQLLLNGLKVTTTETLYPACNTRYWVTEYENIGMSDSQTISQLHDGDFYIRFDRPFDHPERGALTTTPVRVTSYHGSNLEPDDFQPVEYQLHMGTKLTFSCTGGRSSQGTAPFFIVDCCGSGAIFGIGWTGQWYCTLECAPEGIHVIFGIENAEFYLRPGEKVYTASCLITDYCDGIVEGCNAFRRAMKERCVLGKGERRSYGPLSLMHWGAMPTNQMLDRVKKIKALGLEPDCFWIDAGWYGYSKLDIVTEFDGECDWDNYTGSWVVNRKDHPDDLKEVATAVHEAGMDFLLWFEPERVHRDADWHREHPECVIDIGRPDLLLNIGKEDGWKLMYDMLCHYIEELEIDCYRQDFNRDPLPYWREADEVGRSGLTEIHYINGLYRLWDALLDRFPKLYIDNCASGGRRIDLEMLSRSIPLWRSDYQVFYNGDPDYVQCQFSGMSQFAPYSSAGIKVNLADPYALRSYYASGLSIGEWCFIDHPLEESEDVNTLRRLTAEYKKVRPYMSCDYYPLTPYSMSKECWCVWQFNDPKKEEGVVMAFRRERSKQSQGCFMLSGLQKDATYAFVNTDTNQKMSYSGRELMENGLSIELRQPHTSTVFLYQKER